MNLGAAAVVMFGLLKAVEWPPPPPPNELANVEPPVVGEPVAGAA